MAYPGLYPQLYPQNPQQNNTGLVPVPSEMVARNYPVGYGQSVTFKDESAPYIYTKTMGFSQLDAPKFEKYRLVKEEVTPAPEEPQQGSEYGDEIKALRNEIEALKKEVESLKEGA